MGKSFSSGKDKGYGMQANSAGSKLLLLALLALGVHKASAQCSIPPNCNGCNTPQLLEAIPHMGPINECFERTHSGPDMLLILGEIQGQQNPENNINITINNSVCITADGNSCGSCAGGSGGVVTIHNGDVIKITRCNNAGPTASCNLPDTSNDLAYATELDGETILGENDLCVAASPLPVDLKEWIVRCSLETGKLHFRIDVASQVNNEGREIQYSDDGVAREYAGFVPGDGTTSESIVYDYEIPVGDIDDENRDGKVYVRLEQQDFDGTTEFSDTKVVDICADGAVPGLEILGNPVSQKNGIRYALPASFVDNGSVDFRLYNTSGQLVRTYMQDTATGTLPLTGNRLAGGVYILQATDGRAVVQTRVVING